jgi:hypothetical protein
MLSILRVLDQHRSLMHPNVTANPVIDKAALKIIYV